MAYNNFSSVGNIIDKVSQDVRTQLSALANTPGQPILIDYVNRTHKQVLRFSRWGFLLSEPLYFMTAFGQTDYWIGPNNAISGAKVNTGLNLIDVDKIKKDEVRDYSNDSALKPLGAQPLGPTLNFRSGQTRQDQPRAFYQDWNDPNVLHIWPGPDNQNTFQPQPSPPILQYAPGGSLPQRNYYVRITFVDSVSGESTGSNISTNLVIPANNLMTVVSPALFFKSNASGIQYASYNIYASNDPSFQPEPDPNSETLQNTSPIQIGVNWTEPTNGLTTTGVSVPTANTLAQMEGYVIGFRYYKVRLDLTQTSQVLQTPTDYDDIIVQGVNYLAFKILGKQQEAMASQQAYKAGLTEMVWDKNLFPDNDFIRPDAGSYVNTQILGYLPPFF